MIKVLTWTMVTTNETRDENSKTIMPTKGGIDYFNSTGLRMRNLNVCPFVATLFHVGGECGVFPPQLKLYTYSSAIHLLFY